MVKPTRQIFATMISDLRVSKEITFPQVKMRLSKSMQFKMGLNLLTIVSQISMSEDARKVFQI